MTQSVAVIGGSGFIGHSIAEALVRAGHRVAILDCVPPRTPRQAEFRYFDMTQPDPSGRLLREWGSVVISAGALAKSCAEVPWDSWKLNVLATLELITQLASMPTPPRIIFLSSGMVYDRTHQTPPFAETAATRAACLYTASKLAAEHCLTSATYATAVKVLILRPFTVYGRKGIAGNRGHLFGRWLELGARGECLKVHGDGSQVIDPVAVEVVGEACAAYLADPSPAPLVTVNVTSGGCLTILQLAQLFVAAGLAPGVELEPQRSDDRGRGWGEPTALERLLGRPLDANPQREVAAFLRSFNRGLGRPHED
jgi:nucleoside-diphosphate-sugar epimerase